MWISHRYNLIGRARTTHTASICGHGKPTSVAPFGKVSQLRCHKSPACIISVLPVEGVLFLVRCLAVPIGSGHVLSDSFVGEHHYAVESDSAAHRNVLYL